MKQPGETGVRTALENARLCADRPHNVAVHGHARPENDPSPWQRFQVLQATKHLSAAETLVIRLRVRADLDASR
jgi:hypothetical protein